MARKWRCKADPELLMRDHGHGFVDVVLEVSDDIPIVIAYAAIPCGRHRGHWTICTGNTSDDYSDPIDTKAELMEQLDILAAEVRPRAEDSERHWRETWPKSHAAMKRSGPGCSCFSSMEHQQAS